MKMPSKPSNSPTIMMTLIKYLNKGKLLTIKVNS